MPPTPGHNFEFKRVQCIQAEKGLGNNFRYIVDIHYLRLRCVRPLSTNRGRRRYKAMPLLVIPIDLSPYCLSWLSSPWRTLENEANKTLTSH